MNKKIGIFAMLTALVLMLSGVMAQDPAKGKGTDPAVQPPAGGKGGGKGKGNPLASVETFLTKYDTNNDKKVTKKEYMDVSTKDAEDTWKAIASDKADVAEKEIQAYIDAQPKGGKGKGGGKAGG